MTKVALRLKSKEREFLNNLTKTGNRNSREFERAYVLLALDKGNRAGLLQKFSYRGNIFKTYEGELVLSSVESNKNVALASEKFFFSVQEKNFAAKLSNLEGHMIVVHYKQKNGILPWRGETEYIVDSVKENR